MHEHTGHIDCHCLHHKNETVAEARVGGRIHLNSSCFWSCCHARWDDFTCKAAPSSGCISEKVFNNSNDNENPEDENENENENK